MRIRFPIKVRGEARVAALAAHFTRCQGKLRPWIYQHPKLGLGYLVRFDSEIETTGSGDSIVATTSAVTIAGDESPYDICEYPLE